MKLKKKTNDQRINLISFHILIGRVRSNPPMRRNHWLKISLLKNPNDINNSSNKAEFIKIFYFALC